MYPSRLFENFEYRRAFTLPPKFTPHTPLSRSVNEKVTSGSILVGEKTRPERQQCAHGRNVGCVKTTQWLPLLLVLLLVLAAVRQGDVGRQSRQGRRSFATQQNSHFLGQIFVLRIGCEYPKLIQKLAYHHFQKKNPNSRLLKNFEVCEFSFAVVAHLLACL